MFRTILVHHQEQPFIGCTNCTVQLIKCCSWWWTNDSPKHVEPVNEKIKTIHQNLCISLVYIHISIWWTVHTTSNSRAVVLRTQVFLQLISQVVLLLLHVLAKSHSHFQGFQYGVLTHGMHTAYLTWNLYCKKYWRQILHYQMLEYYILCNFNISSVLEI